jgi:RNA-directed DNA polymerase
MRQPALDCQPINQRVVTQQWEEQMNAAKQRVNQPCGDKPYCITKQEVVVAYEKVKANDGAAGVDGQSFEEFEKNLKGNLYKVWNRMSSGSYFPPPVRTVMIPKAQGGERPLGIPTIADRVAQMVVKNRLEPLLDPHFVSASYGYRPGKSALDAVGQARQNCWRYAWVLDLDIKGFFDNIDHALLMRVVRKHTREPWILLYIERWLTAPAQDASGALTAREQGTPQGGVISPLLANLFLHYVFDKWMRTHYAGQPFERYADDVIVHCRSEEEARALWFAIETRLRRCKLELHREKTKIVYCKDDLRRGRYQNEEFTFLGYTFRPRSVRSRSGKVFVGFNPAISVQACQRIRATIRSWQLHRRSDLLIKEIARQYNPVIRGLRITAGSTAPR